LSSFSLNLSEEDVGGTSTERPIGVRKAKSKRKKDDDSLKLIQNIIDDNRELVEVFKQGNANRQQIYELQIIRAQNESKKLAMAEYREDNKILMKDLSYITDPKMLQFFQGEQARIMEKRNQQYQQGSTNASTSFGQYFDNIGGSGNDLSDY
jgi:hypothetical protein